MNNAPHFNMMLRVLPWMLLLIYYQLRPSYRDEYFRFNWFSVLEMTLVYLCAVSMTPYRLRWDWRISTPLCVLTLIYLVGSFRHHANSIRVSDMFYLLGWNPEFETVSAGLLMFIYIVFAVNFRLRSYIAFAVGAFSTCMMVLVPQDLLFSLGWPGRYELLLMFIPPFLAGSFWGFWRNSKSHSREADVLPLGNSPRVSNL